MNARINTFCNSRFSRQEKRDVFFPVRPRICHNCHRPKAKKKIDFADLSNFHQNLIFMCPHAGVHGGAHAGGRGVANLVVANAVAFPILGGGGGGGALPGIGAPHSGGHGGPAGGGHGGPAGGGHGGPAGGGHGGPAGGGHGGPAGGANFVTIAQFNAFQNKLMNILNQMDQNINQQIQNMNQNMNHQIQNLNQKIQNLNQ